MKILALHFAFLCIVGADSSDLSIPEDAVGNPNRNHVRVTNLDKSTKNLCFCNYGGDICIANNTCIKHTNAACFHFMKECNSFRSPHRTPKSIACCYEGNYCNLRIEPPPYRQLPKDPELYDDTWLKRKSHPAVFIIAPVIISTFLIISFCIFGYLKKRRENFWKWIPLVNKPKQQKDSLPSAELEPMYHDDSGSGSGSGHAAMVQRTVANDLIVERIIGKGRQSFYTTEEDSWNNEREIYETQMLNHENILQFVAADIYSMDSFTQMILVTDYHPLGSLYDYLQQEQALSTQEALQLAYRWIGAHSQYTAGSYLESRIERYFERYLIFSICGIEHLHASVIGTGSRRKPQIAHRDIKSKNIIVKRLGMCCMADFGLAVRFEDRLIPEKVNVQVGTKRYMAPEVIRKTLNPNFFAQFKMADMYSYALVLWEIARKVECADVSGTSLGSSESGYGSASSEGKAVTERMPTIYSEMKPDNFRMQHMQKSSDGSRRSYPYKPPFGELVDSDPSFAEMEKIVCGADGKRPALEPSWTNGSNIHLQKMVGLMVDCWHYSPHCRHTALKVKISLGETIEELLAVKAREEKERCAATSSRVDAEADRSRVVAALPAAKAVRDSGVTC
ncbi:unnamed protein product [Nippostrongylus brasiliensis]|uniref:receptor protein serine/threonine kinase n=1 Tax=Nippostrongylus brasiliensis TaxID=27835 RepID=A0A158QXQ5_NIPBR|nr:unnamed protein product [Nippostrongylus brasiliensis]